MEPGHFFELVDFLSFVIDEHLKQQSLSFFADELMHGFIDFNPVLDCIFGSLNQAHFCLIFLFILLFFPKIIQLFYCYPLLFHTLLPNLHFLFLCFLFPLSLSLFLLHPKNLTKSSSYFCIFRHRKRTRLLNP